jgi:hypothetical protein
VPTPAPDAVAPAKKAKKTPAPHLHSKDEELKRMKEDVAKKLRFQNSLDTSTYKSAKGKEKKPKSAAKTPATTSVRVGTYRDKKAAQAKVAELQKQGEKVSLKEGKDQQGVFYTVYRQKTADAQQAASAGQNKPKTTGTKLPGRGE